MKKINWDVTPVLLNYSGWCQELGWTSIENTRLQYRNISNIKLLKVVSTTGQTNIKILLLIMRGHIHIYLYICLSGGWHHFPELDIAYIFYFYIVSGYFQLKFTQALDTTQNNSKVPVSRASHFSSPNSNLLYLLPMRLNHFYWGRDRLQG
jgi:hypothetical protein